MHSDAADIIGRPMHGAQVPAQTHQDYGRHRPCVAVHAQLWVCSCTHKPVGLNIACMSTPAVPAPSPCRWQTITMLGLVHVWLQHTYQTRRLWVQHVRLSSRCTGQLHCNTARCMLAAQPHPVLP